MNRIKLFFCSLLFVSVLGYSQNGLKRDFEIALQYGNASVAIEKTKSIGFFTTANINKEIALGEKYSLLTGITLKDFNLNGGQSYAEIKSFGVPLSLRTYFVKQDKALYAELGLNANYLYSAKFTDQIENYGVRYKNTGFNFGAFYKLGYTSAFNEAFKVNIALCGGQDFGTNFKSNRPEVKNKSLIGIEMGVGINLF